MADGDTATSAGGGDTAAGVRPPLPVLWLLGRTGAGKSSLIRALTGHEADVGSGFSAATRTARFYDHPGDYPLLRFLDTRGLGEAGYDPAEDLTWADAAGHALIVVARLDDPAQGAVLRVVEQVRARRPALPVILALTGADLMPDTAARARATAAMAARFETAAGSALPRVVIAVPPPPGVPEGLDLLRAELAGVLPELALWLQRSATQGDEARNFARHRALVLWYAGAAGASDLIPFTGMVSVPALQGAMLQRLAARHDLSWTTRRAAAFAAALGGSAIMRALAGHGVRQGAKLIPVAGQTIGAAAAASISFAATFALGRAACLWLHGVAKGDPPDPGALRARYAQALRQARDAAR